MKRDNEFLRKMLLEFELKDDWLIESPGDDDKTEYHFHLLSDAGLVTPYGKYCYRLTNSAHDFIEAIRDESVWKQTTKAVVQAGGNVTLDVLKDIAITFLKAKISSVTGLSG